jgi:ABC-type amino acid transport substrate-binding protein
MNNNILRRLAVGTMCLVGSASYAQNVCVFDPMVTTGEVFAIMKDYALMSRNIGVEVNLLPYKDEPSALKDYKSGKCEAATLIDVTARQFNSFTGSLSAVGGITSNAMAKSVINLMGNPKLDADMVSGEHEVIGVAPIGLAYILVKNKEINSLAKAQGIRFGVTETDISQFEMAKKVGAVPVPITVGNMGQKFNSGQVDSMAAPPIAFTVFELHKGLGENGTMFRFPVAFVSMNVLIKHQAFPAAFGAKSRRWFASQTNRMMDVVNRLEKAVPEKYWSELSSNDKVGYVRLMHQMRLEMVKDGVYNKKMTALLKKIRCQQDPTNFECKLEE